MLQASVKVPKHSQSQQQHTCQLYVFFRGMATRVCVEHDQGITVSLVGGPEPKILVRTLPLSIKVDC